MIVTERERGRDTGRGRSRLHAPAARRGIRSRVSRIAPWAKGRRQTTAPPRDPPALWFEGISYESDLKHVLRKELARQPVGNVKQMAGLRLRMNSGPGGTMATRSTSFMVIQALGERVPE